MKKSRSRDWDIAVHKVRDKPVFIKAGTKLHRKTSFGIMRVEVKRSGLYIELEKYE